MIARWTELYYFSPTDKVVLTRSNRRGTDPYARWCGRGGAAKLPPCMFHCRQLACHTAGSVVRRVGFPLWRRPLGIDCSLRLGLKALVHLAAWTAHHKDHLAQNLRRRLTPPSPTRVGPGISPSPLAGGLPCPPPRPLTVLASGSIPHGTVIVSPSSGPITSRPPSRSP